MVHPSKCPSRKVLKSAHSFGRPGKNCTGPDHSDTKHAVDEDSENATNTSTAEVGANASTNTTLLQSLVESVQVLSTEIKPIREETNERALAHPTASAHQQVGPVLPCAITDLAKMVDRCR